MAETLLERGLRQTTEGGDQSADFNKLFLSIKGWKFSLARANTDKGAEFLLHLLDVEEAFLHRLERQLSLTTSDYSKSQVCFQLFQLVSQNG